MRTYHTDNLPNLSQDPTLQQLIYNGLDGMLTLEVDAAIPHTPTYEFERSLLPLALSMMERGIRIDLDRRAEMVDHLRTSQAKVLANFNYITQHVWGVTINPRSYLQMQDLLYKKLYLPEVISSKKGETKISTDRDALERLGRDYARARPIADHLLRLRDLEKTIDSLTKKLSPDGRWHANFNIAGTDCVGGDTLVMTDSGLRRMDYIYQSNHPHKIWDGKGWHIPARKVKYHTLGYILRLKNGYELSCSSNHPVMTQRGFVEAQHLTSDDSVAVFVGAPEFTGNSYIPAVTISDSPDFNRTYKAYIPTNLSQDLAEFYGIMLADGSLDLDPGKHYRLRISNSNRAIQERAKNLGESIFKVPARVSRTEVVFSSRNLADWFKAHGFPANQGHGAASTKTIPEWLMRGKQAFTRALLRGLSCDSHWGENSIAYGTQSPEMQKQIQILLLQLGIMSTRVRAGNSAKLKVSGPSVGKLLQCVGNLRQRNWDKFCKYHQERTDAWHEPPAINTYVYLPLKEKVRLTLDVYDVTMPAEAQPQYLANNWLVHNTGRWSSSSHPFGWGSNLQNIDDYVRRIFIPDPGHIFFNCDQQGAEARVVGYLAGDEGYIKAIESGDVHTMVAAMVFGFEPNRSLADRKYYREMSYRDIAKRAAHGSNYGGTPRTIAQVLKVEIKLIEEFQRRYFKAFPNIKKWQIWTAEQIQTVRHLVTPFGRRRNFWDNPKDDATIRAAIAYIPQSTVGDLTSRGLLAIHETIPEAQILNNIHDAAFGQIPIPLKDVLLPRILEALTYPLRVTDIWGNIREMSIPWDSQCGLNWGKKKKDNPDGLA